MICSACGVTVAQGVNFCPRCGAAIQWGLPPAQYGVPAPPYGAALAPGFAGGTRVQTHVQTLGILWCVYSGYRLLRALLVLLAMHTFLGGAGDNWWGHSFTSGGFQPSWLSPLIPVLGFFALLWSCLAAFTGYSLLTRKPWGRTLAIVVAILTLIRIPVGTALGIYTLWVLAPETSAGEYQSLATRP